MSPTQSRAAVTVPASAANLGPGFDALAVALPLLNEVEATVTPGEPLTVDAGPEAEPELRDASRNLVARAYAATCADLGVSAQGVHLRCVNRIPLRRGLGSSAAAALSGILAAAALHRAGWDGAEVLRRAVVFEGHADNAAAALLGGLAVVAPGCAAVRMAVPDDLRAVVFVPDVELETRAARAVVPETLPRADAVFNASRCALLVRAIALRDYATLACAMDDRWHQRQRAALFPALPALIAAAVGAGARGAALAGAGPSVIALCDGDAAAVEGALTAAAATEGLGGHVLSGPVRNEGAHVEVIG